MMGKNPCRIHSPFQPTFHVTLTVKTTLHKLPGHTNPFSMTGSPLYYNFFFSLLLFLHFLTVLKAQGSNVHAVQTKAMDLALAVRLSEWTGKDNQGCTYLERVT